MAGRARNPHRPRRCRPVVIHRHADLFGPPLLRHRTVSLTVEDQGTVLGMLTGFLAVYDHPQLCQHGTRRKWFTDDSRPRPSTLGGPPAGELTLLPGRPCQPPGLRERVPGGARSPRERMSGAESSRRRANERTVRLGRVSRRAVSAVAAVGVCSVAGSPVLPPYVGDRKRVAPRRGPGVPRPCRPRLSHLPE